MMSAGEPINHDFAAKKFADLQTCREPAMNRTGARTVGDNGPEPLAMIDQIAATPRVMLEGSHEIKIDESYRGLVATASDGLGVRVGLIAGALIASSALTWIVISALPFPLASASIGATNVGLKSPAPDSKKGDRLQIPTTIIPEALPERSRRTSLSVAPPTPSERKHLTNVQAQITSIAARAGDLQAPVKLAPTPETRPTTIEGWTLREVINGAAVLEGPNGTWRVTRGDTVPGVGKVYSIFRWGNRLMVATSKGLISTP